MKKIDYKVPNGKLLRLQADIGNNIVKSIKIAGDFFIYPEEAILKIEEGLKNIKLNDLGKKLNEIIKFNDIKIIGFNPDDLAKALNDNTKFKVAVAQLDLKIGDKEKNIKKASEYIAEAKNKGAGIVCLPEYFSTGSMLKKFSELAETIPGNTTNILSNIAKENKISIITSIIEKEKNNLYNTAVFISSNGKLAGKNRKINLFLHENEIVSPGKEYNVIDTKYDKIGMMVCYDTIFPEIARNLTLNGAKIIFIPANWPNPFLSQWRLATSARALDNQTWIVATNRIGKDDDFTYFGRSRIVDPYGELAVEGGDKEELIVFDIDLKKSDEFKQTVNFIQDRKKQIKKGNGKLDKFKI